MSTFNFQESVNYLVACMAAPDVYPPLLLEGDMGRGKSAVPKVAADIIAAKHGARCHVIDLRLAHCDAGDIKGMPERGNGYTFYEKGTWFPMHVEDRAALKKVIESLGRKMMETGMEEDFFYLFLDELNRAPRDVQQAVFQLVYDRKLDDVRLSDRTVVVSAINDNSDLYQTTRMDPALLNRFAVVQFKPSDKEWLSFLEGLEGGGKGGYHQVHSAIRMFLSNRNEYIDPSPEHIEKCTDKNTQTFSRRSWTRLGAVMIKEEAARGKPVTEWDDGWLIRIAGAIVGIEAAQLFCNFVENEYQVLNPHDLVFKYTKDASKRVLKGRPDELASVVDEVVKILAKEVFSKPGAFTLTIQQNLFCFLTDLPDEIAQKLSQSLSRDNSVPNKDYLAFTRNKDLKPTTRLLGKDNDGKVMMKKYDTPLQRITDIMQAGRK